MIIILFINNGEIAIKFVPETIGGPKIIRE
jgi:hypothetical protein